MSEDLRAEETDPREGAAATRKAVAALRTALFNGDLAPGSGWSRPSWPSCTASRGPACARR